MITEEAEEIRNNALKAHIQMGHQQLQQMQERINKMTSEYELVAREVAAMEEAQARLSEGPPATDPTDEPEDQIEEGPPYEEI